MVGKNRGAGGFETVDVGTKREDARRGPLREGRLLKCSGEVFVMMSEAELEK
jgi:hypothetical protein